ncbi:hypothetical protein [Paenibacillus sp. ATY16]|nr:hypothetical protein [Paenibacillus sp. ATY16]MCK9859063.1 hypothetical protein [Paenibacillus sp. ATY16]
MNMPPLSPVRTVYLAELTHIVALMESGLAEPCSRPWPCCGEWCEPGENGA